MKKRIYGLVDPRDGFIYYIGATDNLPRKYGYHISDARKGGIQLVDGWVLELLEEDLVPEIVVLEDNAGDDWKDLRRKLIAEYGAINVGLLNIWNNEQRFPFITPETRQKLSAAMKRRYADPEYRRFLSEMMKEKWQDPKMRKKYIDGQKRAWDKRLGIHYEE